MSEAHFQIQGQVDFWKAARVEVGRDPKTTGKSAGIVVDPTEVARLRSGPRHADPRLGRQTADRLRSFGTARVTNLELVVWQPPLEPLHAIATVLELVDVD